MRQHTDSVVGAATPTSPTAPGDVPKFTQRPPAARPTSVTPISPTALEAAMGAAVISPTDP